MNLTGQMWPRGSRITVAAPYIAVADRASVDAAEPVEGGPATSEVVNTTPITVTTTPTVVLT